jgi:protein disulfide-isomerase
MRQYISLVLGVFTCIFAVAFTSESTLQAVNSSIEWNADYTEALQLSKQTKKPVLLLFTGSGWCSYCNKLEKEVFATPQFAAAAQNDYIFVKMDFSSKGAPRHPVFYQQHTDLGSKFNITGFPTVILLDQNENTIVRTGYRQGGATDYAKYLKSNVESHVSTVSEK